MIIQGYEFLIGADPEVFVKKNDKLISAYNLIPGTKEAPYPVDKGAVQVDGMALEFNINPAKDQDTWESNLTSVLETLKSMVPGCEIFISSVAEFGKDYIDSQPEKAKTLGCDPDYNAYTQQVNPVPQASQPFRTASGHIHIGWQSKPVNPLDPGHFEACVKLTKMLDLFVGAPSVIWESSDKRRELYGKAGAFRPKPYGMEYRVLSNEWLLQPYLRRFVYYNTIEAIKSCFTNPSLVSKIDARSIIDDQKILANTPHEYVNEKSEVTTTNMLAVNFHKLFVELGVKPPKDYK